MNMYAENRKSINAFVGCRHNCVYCKPSFQRQAKRQRKNCELCYSYEPHSHLERLLKAPPKTVDGDFIFFPSMGDLAFANKPTREAHIAYAEKYPDTTFLMQTKNPLWFNDHQFPNNVILAVTVETNQMKFVTPSKYRWYRDISDAIPPRRRLIHFLVVEHPRKIVVIEPILDFILNEFVEQIKQLHPEAVYVGYDNHNCKLPEPRLKKTKLLTKELGKFTEVRAKTLRKAWYEH